MGSCQFFFALGHDTANCIVTQGLGGSTGVHSSAPRYDRAGTEARSRTLRHGPTIRARGTTTQPACARGKQQHARVALSRWGVSRYNRLYHDRRAAWCRDTARQGCNTTPSALRHDARELRHAGSAHDTARGGRDRELCCDTDLVS